MITPDNVRDAIKDGMALAKAHFVEFPTAENQKAVGNLSKLLGNPAAYQGLADVANAGGVVLD